ncbi:sporulation protein YpjB [Paludifilum halophilum]|nr:sporulation protein YpjB [Paludifilum halophilum]
MVRLCGFALAVFLLGTGFFSGGAVTVLADHVKPDPQAKKWARQADRVEGKVAEGRWAEARKELNQLAESFSKADLSRSSLTVEGVRALSDTLVEADRQLNRVMVRPEELAEVTQRVHLAFDALAQPHQPLWHRFEGSFRSRIGEVRSGLKKNRPEAVRRSGRKLIEHYEQIRPALYVVRSPTTVEKTNALMSFLQKELQKEELEPGTVESAVDQWERMISPLFYGPEEEVLAIGEEGKPPLIPALLSVGGVIAGVLSYVSWRKYRYSRRTALDRG